MARPVNCLISFISVWTAALVAADIFISVRIMAASLSAAVITAGGNVINDYFDFDSDKINKPFRPLPSGSLNRGESLAAAAVFGATGLGLSLYVDLSAFIIAAAVIFLLTIYTPVFKGLLFIGNLIIALVASMAFVYGGVAAGKPFGALILAMFAFLFHLGREIVKDIEDISADNQSGHRTGASIDNCKTARVMAGGVFGLLMISTILPFISGQYGIGYLLSVATGVDSILIYSIIMLYRTDNPRAMRRISAWLKAAMPLGLLAVFLGSRGL